MPHATFKAPTQPAPPIEKHGPRHLPTELEPLLRAFRRPTAAVTPADVDRMTVNTVVSKLANAYEKIRNAIEYHEDHLLRKNAVERILKRRLLFGTHLTEPDLARSLILELIRGGYLPNAQIPETKIGEVATIILKHRTLQRRAHGTLGTDAQGFTTWLTAITATEIEECLVPATRSEALVNFAYHAIRKDMVWKDDSLDPRERDLQLYLATHRALIRSDEAMIRTHLFHLYEPRWRNADDRVITEVASRLGQLRAAIDVQVRHPFGDPILRQVKKFSTVFLILRDVLESPGDPTERLADPAALEPAIKRAAEKRYQSVQQKIRRAVVRAVIYIFVTKMLLALAVEFPYELFVARSIDYVPLAVNVFFHPFLLFLIAISVNIPAERNTRSITRVLEGLLYRYHQRNLPIVIRRPRRGVLTAVFRFVYAATFLLSFGLIVWGLRELTFNAVSIVIFLLFLSIISFFGIRIRQQTRELIVVPERENVLTLLIDFFSVPVLQVGRWISVKAPKINVFIFILDFIIEAPFKTLVAVAEDWFSFLREKKEEVY
ncbi:MAG: hypothetical protein HYZ09_02250 [Candidatus Kerfeldbacteria bacterium]|nr:hypothetical protein [Candidatus Kerfeldbacteria bacterium]